MTGTIPREDWLRLGDAHRTLRRAANITIIRVARDLNLRTSDISEMENGRADPTPIVRRLLAVMGDGG